jgi:hypothetical protein
LTRSIATKADRVRRDRLRELLNSGCACHLDPPCDLCSQLDKDEWDIFNNDGTDAMLNLFDSLDEELESADRPMAAAAEQAAAALAAAEQRGAERERAAIAAWLRAGAIESPSGRWDAYALRIMAGDIEAGVVPERRSEPLRGGR